MCTVNEHKAFLIVVFGPWEYSLKEKAIQTHGIEFLYENMERFNRNLVKCVWSKD